MISSSNTALVNETFLYCTCVFSQTLFILVGLALENTSIMSTVVMSNVRSKWIGNNSLGLPKGDAALQTGTISNLPVVLI